MLMGVCYCLVIMECVGTHHTKSCIMSNVYNLTENKIVDDEWMGFNILQATTHPLSNIYVFIFIVEYTLYLIQYILGTFRCPGQDLDLCLTQFCPVM